VVADLADATLAARMIADYRPGAVVLNAGATPHAAPLEEQTWEGFSQNWEVDVQHVFRFLREALITPLDPGSVVISFSSGAAVRGSQLSGGYAGAKATIRFLSSYARAEAERDSLGIRLSPGFGGREENAERMSSGVGIDPQFLRWVGRAVVEEPGTQGQCSLVLGIQLRSTGDAQVQMELLRDVWRRPGRSRELPDALEREPV
jgi:NAD(P)-dependent dehydrogenase (short-subunit alcohol dehydrogenase family)